MPLTAFGAVDNVTETSREVPRGVVPSTKWRVREPFLYSLSDSVRESFTDNVSHLGARHCSMLSSAGSFTEAVGVRAPPFMPVVPLILQRRRGSGAGVPAFFRFRQRYAAPKH